ncbi:hypothetical protein [Halorubrum ezzemoulense]|uniref:hypothetical protein n=1 Tax=Halorubrum ezzemoulense TaxID=337243 RepID=UPI00232E81EA|nr:hypothetical protein [Halorubrum ezzemoulense]MDB2239133.1 hypothetical protein [Halorubrum ezzemoulense]MDB2249682.1 hypothetical protein [Halorubrum ezzemoulense]
MTDASLSVTQRRVEQFAKTYLEMSGCSVQERDDELVVNTPQTAVTDLLDPGTTTLVCTSDPERIGDKLALHPESETFQGLLREATDQAAIGRVELIDADTEIRLPDWLVESEVSVASTRFMPYYDRTAVIGLFRIGIETVSEYQTAVLRTSAVDTNSMEELPALTDQLLVRATPDSPPMEAAATNLDEGTVREAIDSLGELLVEQTQPKITEIQEGATRAAGAELDEYRQLQDQRIEELESEISAVSNKIERLSVDAEEIDSQAERLENLQERKNLKTKREELQDELGDLTEARAGGFPKKRREVRNRHTLDVEVKPLTLTEFQYEQGELEVTIVGSGDQTSVRVGYGNGVGVTEPLACECCGSTLSGENPLHLNGKAICCVACRE